MRHFCVILLSYALAAMAFQPFLGMRMNKQNVAMRIYMVRNDDLGRDNLFPSTPIQKTRSDVFIKVAANSAVLFASFLPTRKAFGATANRGAFEMDMDYYLQNVLNGNQGKSSSDRRTFFASGRVIDNDTSKEIVRIIEEETVKLLRRLQGQVPADVAQAKNAFASVPDKVQKLLPEFKQFVPITQDNLQDNYYLDIYLLILYREIANLLPLSEQRVSLRRNVGEAMLSWVRKQKDISPPPLPPLLASKNGSAANVSSLAQGIQLLLSCFVNLKLIGAYKFDIDDFADEESATFSFQENLPISFQFTLQAPVTILSFIEQYKEDTFFHPDIFATTVSCLCREYGFGVRFDDYLLDNFYRESNFDVVGQDVLVEMEIIDAATKDREKNGFVM